MLIEVRAVGPFFKNGFIVECKDTREAVLIDPGDEVDSLLDIVAARQLAVKYILLTHAHVDHVTGVGRAKSSLDVPVCLHRDDKFLYDAAPQQAAMFGVHTDPLPPIDHFYEANETLAFGRLRARVHHTPGHCPGGVCLQIGDLNTPGRQLFVGDTLFAGSIGRTDLPGGDYETLIRSIRDVLFAFPDEATVYPGHGPTTTIGQEKRTNPFLTS